MSKGVVLAHDFGTTGNKATLFGPSGAAGEPLRPLRHVLSEAGLGRAAAGRLEACVRLIRRRSPVGAEVCREDVAAVTFGRAHARAHPERANEAATQSLRCHAPAELRSLSEGTGVELVEILPGGAVDRKTGEYRIPVSLEAAMNYLATPRPVPLPENQKL